MEDSESARQALVLVRPCAPKNGTYSHSSLSCTGKAVNMGSPCAKHYSLGHLERRQLTRRDRMPPTL